MPRANLLLRFLDEVTRRDSDQQQERADDGRGADDLHGLALVFRTEIALSMCPAHTKSIRSTPDRSIGRTLRPSRKSRELGELRVRRADHRSLPEEDAGALTLRRPRVGSDGGFTDRDRWRLPRRRRHLEGDRELERAILEGLVIVLPLQNSSSSVQ